MKTDKDKTISDDLEQEIVNYINKNFHIKYDETLEVGNSPITTFDFEKIARHFVEWQKERMLKDAVDGEVCYDSNGAYVESDYDTKVYGSPGDKIKIIIVKED